MKFGWKPRVLVSEGHVTPIYFRCFESSFKKIVNILLTFEN